MTVLAPSEELVRTLPVPAQRSATIGPPGPNEWRAITQMALTLAASSLIPKALKGKPDDIAVILLAARDLQVPPTIALQKIYVIDGKPAQAAELMGALIMREGHTILPITTSSQTCRIKYRRRDWPADHWSEHTFTVNDARKAGLLDVWFERWVPNGSGGGNHKESYTLTDGETPPTWVRTLMEKGEQPKRRDPWFNFRSAMLWARCLSAVARISFPDVLNGVSYIPEELGALTDGEGNVIDVASSVGEVIRDSWENEPQHTPLDVDHADQTSAKVRFVQLVAWLAHQAGNLPAHLTDDAVKDWARRQAADAWHTHGLMVPMHDSRLMLIAERVVDATIGDLRAQQPPPETPGEAPEGGAGPDVAPEGPQGDTGGEAPASEPSDEAPATTPPAVAEPVDPDGTPAGIMGCTRCTHAESPWPDCDDPDVVNMCPMGDCDGELEYHPSRESWEATKGSTLPGFPT